ncbi:MAG: molybdenum cofactor biosynthesis protein MoaE [Bacteroidia bacterium]|nr:molybdenum cofactor biosynthesis protein MoaE [Bacteroidia bacterium]
MEKKPKNIFVAGAISSEKIATSIQNHSTKLSIGGHSIFLGQVRADTIDNQEVQSIHYSAYEPMALEVAFRIREDIFQKYPLVCMHIYHSLGEVKAGEISLFVFTSAIHRQPAIEACTEVVERIKKELPVWGKEILTTGNVIWKENKI